TRRRTRGGRRGPRADAIPGGPDPRSDAAHQPAALPAQPVLARVPRGPRVRGARRRCGDGAAGRAPDAERGAVEDPARAGPLPGSPAIPAPPTRAGGADPRGRPGWDPATGGGVRPARRRGRARTAGAQVADRGARCGDPRPFLAPARGADHPEPARDEPPDRTALPRLG